MPWNPDADTPTRALARSLFSEYLAQQFALASVSAPPSSAPPSPGGRGHGRPPRWPRGAVIQAIQAFTRREGHVPSRQAWRVASRHHLPGYATVLALFGSLDAAYEAAGEVCPPRTANTERCYGPRTEGEQPWRKRTA